MSPKLMNGLAVLLVACTLPTSLWASEPGDKCEFLSLGAGYYCCFEKLCCHAMVNAHRCNKMYNEKTQQFIVTPPEAAVEVQCERSFIEEDLTRVCCVPPPPGPEHDHCYCPSPRRWCPEEPSGKAILFRLP